MKRKIVFISLLVLLLIVSLYYFTKKEDIDEVIEQSIGESKEVAEVIDEAVTDEDSDSKKGEQIKVAILDTFRGTLGLLLKKEPRVLAIGDSLTQGVGDETNNGGYVGILDRTINEQKSVVEFTNLGRSGNRTDQLLVRLEDSEVIKSIRKADVVLVTIGANDIMRVLKENITNLTYEPFAEERIYFEERLHSIFDIITEENTDADIYLLGFFNPFKQYFPDIDELETIVGDWNQTGKSLSEQYDRLTFIPMKDIFDYATEDLFSDDNFHPNLLGYQKMAERVLEYLTKEENTAQ